MSRSRKPPARPGSMASLADILPVLSKDLEIDRKVNEMALLALWPRQVLALMGDAAAAGTKAVRLRKQGNRTVLYVRASTAALATELGFYLPALQAALNGFSPQTGIMVDRIQISVGLR